MPPEDVQEPTTGERIAAGFSDSLNRHAVADMARMIDEAIRDEATAASAAERSRILGIVRDKIRGYWGMLPYSAESTIELVEEAVVT